MNPVQPNSAPPAGIIGQLQSSMNAGVQGTGQVSSQSPSFDPSLQPAPNAQMPSKSPASLIHKTPLHGALKRRGIDPSTIPQMMGQNGQPVPNPVVNPAPGLPPHPVQNMPPTNLTSPQVPGAPVEKPLSEAEALVKALEKIAGTFGKRLDTHSAHETAIREHLFPPKKEEGSEEE